MFSAVCSVFMGCSFMTLSARATDKVKRAVLPPSGLENLLLGPLAPLDSPPPPSLGCHVALLPVKETH